MSATTDLLAVCRVPDVSWYFIARQAQRPAGLADLLSGHAGEVSLEAQRTLQALSTAGVAIEQFREEAGRTVEAAAADGIHLTTVLDDDYPANLRLIYNPPPFLFYRGELREDDALSVAVVGTRMATDEGLRRARKLAGALADAGVTVLSGLARGIDTAAHEACLDAGGRTIAVLGSGVRRVYPPENGPLAERIAATGALVSQFWPERSPGRDTFPRRNIVMSGLGQGTAVIEASGTSGAKMQARYALEHGKRLFLLASLVDEREWARRYLQRGAIKVQDTADILRLLRSADAVREQVQERLQLALALG